ncbi:MAG: hypothetical protein HY647_03160 [Acidobacteria bacterium]|nr:hypothetical protein [Acidobacteriota bacterium]
MSLSIIDAARGDEARECASLEPRAASSILLERVPSAGTQLANLSEQTISATSFASVMVSVHPSIALEDTASFFQNRNALVDALDRSVGSSSIYLDDEF